MGAIGLKEARAIGLKEDKAIFEVPNRLILSIMVLGIFVFM